MCVGLSRIWFTINFINILEIGPTLNYVYLTSCGSLCLGTATSSPSMQWSFVELLLFSFFYQLLHGDGGPTKWGLSNMLLLLSTGISSSYTLRCCSWV